MRHLAAMGVAALAGCVFDTSGLLPPNPDRPSTAVEAASVDRTKDVPVDTVPLDRPADTPPDPADLAMPELPRDLPRSELKNPDLPKPDLKNPDLPKADLKKPDLPKADLKKTDLPKPDQKNPDLPKPSCQSIFGAVTGYSLCTETGTSCRFYFSSASNKTCTQICGSHPCTKAEDNAGSQKCVLESPNICGSGPCTCSSSIGDGICTCTK